MGIRTALKARIVPKLNHRPKEIPLPRVVPGIGIPKVLHQVFFSEMSPAPPMPAEIQANIARIRALNPGWDYQLYDLPRMRSYIAQHYGAAILASFNRIAPEYAAAKADLFRYLLLYREGGVYLDVKSSMAAPLDSFIQPSDVYLLAQWRNWRGEPTAGWGLHHELRHIPGGEFQQWHVISAPGHPFLRAVILNVLANLEAYVPAIHGVGKNGVLRVTGPTAYTLAIAPFLDQAPHRRVDPHDDFPLIYSIYGHDAHFSVFKRHYSQMTAPIVDIGLAKRMLSHAFEGVFKLERVLKRA